MRRVHPTALDAPLMFLGPPLNLCMETQVLTGCQQLKIRQVVVVADVIDVVNVLIASKGSPELLLHEPAMFGHPASLAPSDLDLHVSVIPDPATTRLDAAPILFLDRCYDLYDFSLGLLVLPSSRPCRFVAVPWDVARVVHNSPGPFRDVWLDLLAAPTPTHLHDCSLALLRHAEQPTETTTS